MNFAAPGIYLIDMPSGPVAFAGVSTSRYSEVGFNERGPVNDPRLYATWLRFVEKTCPKHNGFFPGSFATYCAFGFYANDGGTMVFNRVVPDDAVKASVEIDSPATAAEFIGRPVADPVNLTDETWVAVKIDAAAVVAVDVTDGGGAGAYALADLVDVINTALGAERVSLVNDVTGYKRFKIVSPTTGATSLVQIEAPVIPDPPGGVDGTSALFGLQVLPKSFAGLAEEDLWDVTAYSEGVWAGSAGGDGVRLTLQGNDDYGNDLSGWTRFDTYIWELGVDGVTWEVVGSYEAVELQDPTSANYFPDVINADSEIVAVDEGTDKVLDNAAAPYTKGIPRGLVPGVVYSGVYENQLEAVQKAAGSEVLAFSFILPQVPLARGGVTISWTGPADEALTMTDDKYGAFNNGESVGTVDYTSGLVTLTFALAERPKAVTAVRARYVKTAYSSPNYDLAGGSDGTETIAQKHTTSPALMATNKGIYAFNKFPDPMQVAVPDLSGVSTVHNDLISWAKVQQNRYVILAFAQGTEFQEMLDFVRAQTYDCKEAAIYGPWIKIADPNKDNRISLIPPQGHVAGVYARTDQKRNVGKAPAGMETGYLNWCEGFEYDLIYLTFQGEGEVGALNKARINCLIQQEDLGKVVMGARTLSLDPNWRYINGVRLQMFVKISIYRGTQWVAFQNNGPRLWTRVSAQVTSFLQGLFRQDYMAG
ncbi:phage tail sheath subtilisin-like domain-containing protein, partial [Candidatus Dependentiae bacterium]|nr:phage tail sheath subtilisin-like domain-containing protein [Candidatus Dependentiae bacterium]